MSGSEAESVPESSRPALLQVTSITARHASALPCLPPVSMPAQAWHTQTAQMVAGGEKGRGRRGRAMSLPSPCLSLSPFCVCSHPTPSTHPNVKCLHNVSSVCLPGSTKVQMRVCGGKQRCAGVWGQRLKMHAAKCLVTVRGFGWGGE